MRAVRDRPLRRSVRPTARDDAVLPATRWLAAVIAPVLLVAWLVLYPVPTATDRWFAWEINPTMTPMVLGSAYLGGAYFFARVLRARAWHTVHIGFVPVTAFASCLGVATILHWEKFNHDHVAFWLWAGLYFTTPFLVAAVWLVNRRRDPGSEPDVERLSIAARIAMAGVGVGAVATGLFLVVVPDRAIDIWPWTLTPLTSRVLGAVLLLGVAGVVVALDGRWTATALVLDVARIMVVLMLIAGIRARDELHGDRPLTWLFAIGIAAVLVGATLLRARGPGHRTWASRRAHSASAADS